MINSLLDDDNDQPADAVTAKPDDAGAHAATPPVSDISLIEDRDNSRNELFGTSFPLADAPKDEFVPESFGETARKSGLAWSAAIVLFGSVVFMLTLGWFADLLLGSSPWGVVGGIVFGAVIGFLQFFRITSQILRPPRR